MRLDIDSLRAFKTVLDLGGVHHFNEVTFDDVFVPDRCGRPRKTAIERPPDVA